VKEASDYVDIYTAEKLAKKPRLATEIASISVSVAKLLVLPVWGSFYFRFVPDGVLHSRTVSTQMEVDRAYPKTVS